jgi:oxygen-independent coproporphyrinogen-3 oxidase
MDQAVSKYIGARVPRYTSYPTANHFSAQIGDTDVRGWLGGIPEAAPLSLYLHIPFCRKMCWYCACNMKLAARYEPVAAYVGRLIGEINLIADAIPQRRRVTHIHWGGGTPTVLSSEDFARVDQALRDRFDIASDADIAVEIDPRTLTEDAVETLRTIGCNRASLGVQEFDIGVQKAINRIQPCETVEEVTNWLRMKGITAINFDLMYGLPHQTSQMLSDTIRRAIRLEPDRIALFGYAHVPWVAKNQRMIETAAIPGADARFEMAEAASDLIQSLGYRRIGIDHFARPDDSLSRAARSGHLRRNFQGYTADDAEILIGMGASAISAFPQGYAQNIVETGAYMRAIGEGRLPIAKGLGFHGEDLLRRTIIERLMCDFAVDLDAVANSFHAPVSGLQPSLERLDAYLTEGFVEFDGHKLRITKRGRPLTRLIAAAFDAYLSGENTGHSAL